MLPSKEGAFPQTPFPEQLAVTDAALWIVWWFTDPIQLVRIDAAAAKISAAANLPYPVRLAAGDGGLWAAGPTDTAPAPELTSVYRIDRASGDLTELAPVRWGARGFSAGLGWLWAEGKGGLWRMDQATGRRAATIATPTPGPDHAIGCGALWSLDSNGDDTELWRLDTATGSFRDAVVTAFFAARPVGTADSCWLVSRNSVQPLTGDVVGEPTIQAPVFIAGQSVWTITGDVVRRIDLASGLPIEPGWRIDGSLITMDEKGDSLAFADAGGFLWLLHGDLVIGFDIPTG